MRTRESTATLWVVRVGASRGLARKALYLDLILNMLGKMFLTVFHFPFPGVSAVFVSLRSFGDCPLGDVSLCEVLRCIWGGYGRRRRYCLVVSGLPFWPFSGSGGLMLLGLVV